MGRSAIVVSNVIPLAGKRMSKRGQVYPGSTLSIVTVCRLARKLVAEVVGCKPADLVNPSRGERIPAFGRQVAIHLAHIVAGRRHEEIAREFLRNRSTAQHHFEVLENLRDEPAFDIFLDTIEVRYAHQLDQYETKLSVEFNEALDALAKSVQAGRLEADAHYDAKFVVETFRPKRRAKA